MRETYEFTSRFPKPVPLTLTLPARTTTLPMVQRNGKRVPCAFDADAVGAADAHADAAGGAVPTV